MKTLICLLATILGLQFSLSAQDNFLPGYIVSNEGDTTFCEIDYRNWRTGPQVITAKVDGYLAYYKPWALTSFAVNNEVYQSAIVRAKTHSRRKLEYRIDTTFVLTLVDGEKSLYYYRKKGRHFLIKDETGFVPLINQGEEVEDGWTGEQVLRSGYKKKLITYFGADKEFSKIINRSEYTHESLVTLFYIYDDSTPGIRDLELFDTFKSHASFGIIGGLKREQVQFGGTSPYITFLTDHEFTPNLSPTLGFFLNYPQKRNFRRISFYTEYVFTSFRTEGEYEHFNNSGDRSLYDIAIRHVGLNIVATARYRASVNQGTGLFLHGGFAGSILGHNNRAVVQRFEPNGIPEDEYNYYLGFGNLPFRFGALAGAGYMHKDLFAELRAETSISGTGWSNRRFVKLHFLLGYSF